MNADCRKFFRWLKEKNLYIKWMRNHAQERIVVNLKTTTIKPANFISSKFWSFDWSTTPEGFNFWNCVDDEWKMYLASGEDWRTYFASKNVKYIRKKPQDFDIVYEYIHRN